MELNNKSKQFHKKTQNLKKRYFESADDNPNESVEHSFILSKQKHGKFEGDVINVENQAKPYYHSKWKKNPKSLKPTVSKTAMARHSRGAPISASGVKTNSFKDKLQRKEVYVEFSNEQAARTEILRNEEDG